jgi:xanthine dehydrogenase small subunit
MRNFISFLVNGEKQTVRGGDAFLTLSDYLRLRLGLCGTKIVCSEGDCGSCSILCGFPILRTSSASDGKENGSPGRSTTGFKYRSIDSCIRFVFQLDGQHIVTVEGLAKGGQALNGVQQAMVDCHGSQCGFCTPGFVMAMTGMLQDTDQLSVDEIRHGLTGNLCRCTGYSPIIEAACQPEVARNARIDEIYPPGELLKELTADQNDGISITRTASDASDACHVFCPASLQEATELLKAQPTARIVAGATDLGVQFNKGHLHATSYIDLNRVRELEGVVVRDQTIVAGARATWAEIEAAIEPVVPQFKEIVSVFGSPQIRHVGTIGGNLINASPIADSIPFLFVCDATLTLVSADGTRTVNINDFYFDYKKFDLQPGELLTKIEIPLPADINSLRLYKITRRRDLDISTFTAAIHLETSGAEITRAKLAYGAVGPVVLRMKNTEAFLAGKKFTLETMQQAGDIAVDEISPLTDVRGSMDYRNNLARNVLVKYFYEMQTTQMEVA